MLQRYCGYDPEELAIIPRSPASRFSEDEVGTMVTMAADGASSLEISAVLGIKAEAIRARLNRMGIRLRKRIARSRIRMVLDVPRIMREAAEARGITPQQLIRRLLRAVCHDNLFDELLPLPVPHSLGAAAVHERSVASVPLATLRSPQLYGVSCLQPVVQS
jgi:hypothetical protein